MTYDNNDGPIYSVLNGKTCCTSNLNISGMSSANGCYTYDAGMNANGGWYNASGGYVIAYMNGSHLQVYDLINSQQIAYIIFNEGTACPSTGTHLITGGNATIVCGC